MLLVSVLSYAQAARAQYSEAPDAGAPSTAPASASAPAPAPAPAPSPASPTTSSSSSSEGRPARGPSVRERSSRRSRAGSTASGALFLVVIVGWMGWYVIKRLRR